MKHRSTWANPLARASALLGLCSTTLAVPLITNVVETGGDNEATDTITAKWTGLTWDRTVANEPSTGEAGTPFTMGLFQEDVPCFVDRNHQWNGISAEMPLPDYLVGGEYIMSGNDNRDNASLQMDITVSEDVLVYLLVDTRLTDGNAADPPESGLEPIYWTAMAWLGADGYQPVMTGWNLTADPALPDLVGVDEGGDGLGAGAGINTYAAIYSKTQPKGTFSIYQADNAGRNMYGVVIKRLPNSVTAPPVISNLTPANNTLFYPAANGLSFTTTTVSPNNIAATNIKVTLNGTEVSANLTIGGSGTSRSVSYSGLQPDMVYRAQIIVSDQAGRSTTNNLAFDTLVAANVVMVEAEDYNHDGGQFTAAPPPGSYANLSGTKEVDYHNNNGTTRATLYRPDDYVGLAASGDVTRDVFTSAGATDYLVTGTQAGDWWNYTRALNGKYRVYLRGSTTVAQKVRLDRVADATAASQTTSALGTFEFSGPAAATPFEYAPLADATGKPVVVSLTGNSSLRLTPLAANVDLQLNYLLFVPVATDATPAYLASASPPSGALAVAPDTAVKAVIANGSSPVNPGTILLKFNGADVTAASTVTPFSDGVAISYDPPGDLDLATPYPVSLAFSDAAGAASTADWSFTTVGSVTVIPANYGTALGTGQNGGFRFKMRKAPDNDINGAAYTLANTSARANQQLADQLIDPGTQEPYFNEAGGPNNDGLATGTLVNFDQLGAAAGYFGSDEPFPYVDPTIFTDPNNMALEVTAYVELTAGMHRFGVRSDDGFMLTCGPTFADANLVLGVYEGGRGNGLPGGASEFEFQVLQDGVYGIRLIWYEGNGGANVELYSVDRDTFTRTLLNDTAKTGAVKAYRDRSTQIYVPTISVTSPTEGASYATVPANVVLTADAAVTSGSIAKVEFFAGSDRLGEATTAPYTLNWQNLNAGPYTVTAKATSDIGLTRVSAPVRFEVGVPIRVNFQPASATTPDGYLPDYGSVFGDQGNGHSYGWDVDNTANARERNDARSPDKRYDTFNHMQKPQPAGSLWEIQVPNGRYNVYAVVGEASNTDSAYDLTAEGVTIVKGTPTDTVRWYEDLGAVTVADGRLSLGSGPTAANNKIAFVDIYPMVGEAEPPQIDAPTVASGALTITWRNGGTLESAPAVTGPWTSTGDSDGSFTETATGPAKFYRVKR